MTLTKDRHGYIIYKTLDISN